MNLDNPNFDEINAEQIAADLKASTQAPAKEEASAKPSFAERHPALVAAATVFGGVFAIVAVATAAATVGTRVGMIGAPKDHPLYER